MIAKQQKQDLRLASRGILTLSAKDQVSISQLELITM